MQILLKIIPRRKGKY